MDLILLPGLDGSGILFRDLIAALPTTLNPCVIYLDELNGESFSEKAFDLSNKIQDSEVIIIAESYSGRIAYELCDLLGKKIKRVIFLASFITSPSYTSKLAHIIPTAILKESHLNTWLLLHVGFAGYGSKHQAKHVFKSISLADKQKLKNRLNNIAALDKPLKSYDTKAIYIKPTHDLLVSKRAIKELLVVFKNTQINALESGHFIAQTQPIQCAKIIISAVNEYKNENKPRSTNSLHSTAP
ncbi:hypothetical protein WNY63_00930 [Pseudoalteromonas neustonica]|uniref:Alpha/beta hydrolase n=1 Tax=Pseudoalteromonas neustonica TaxID=1840331 RepID=A0ABU9TWY4_9GAMM